MKIVDEIKKQLENKVTSFKVKGEISGALWAEINVTDLTGSHICLATQLENTKFRAQSLASGAIIVQGTYRIDNSHSLPLHQHTLWGTQIITENLTFKDALLRILGSEYWRLENEKE